MVTVPVDDRDPSVTYSGVWNQVSNDLAYNSTMTGLGEAGSTAKISFTGSSIGVYGTDYAKVSDGPDAPACLYTIDEGTPVRVTSNQTGITEWGQLFFQSPVLPKASHVLTIEYDDDFRTKYALLLDAFMVNDGTLPSVPSSALTASFLSSTTTTSFTTPQSSVLSPASSFSTLESSSSSPTLGATPGVATVLVQGKAESKLPIGPIIGGALGALTFICTALLILYLRRRWREGHSNEDIGAPPPIGRSEERPQIIPYDISQLPQHGRRGKSFVGARTGVATTTKVAISSFATGAVQRSTSQRGPTAAATSSTLGNMTNPNNLVSVGALPRTLPISGDPQAGNDPPPSYRESFQD